MKIHVLLKTVRIVNVKFSQITGGYHAKIPNFLAKVFKNLFLKGYHG
jgi:hypothetical protein